ncbi:MAG TPA: hypothetical protein VGL46_11320 [Pseudonocardiaceae bacterium]|jgi:hypothetical protein
MLVDDARRLATEIEERLNASACQGVKATVKAEQMTPKTVPSGAGRPTFTNYYIQIDDHTRMATLTLPEAAVLLDDVEPGWDPDRLFDAIRAMDVSVEKIS